MFPGNISTRFSTQLLKTPAGSQRDEQEGNRRAFTRRGPTLVGPYNGRKIGFVFDLVGSRRIRRVAGDG